MTQPPAASPRRKMRPGWWVAIAAALAAVVLVVAVPLTSHLRHPGEAAQTPSAEPPPAVTYPALAPLPTIPLAAPPPAAIRLNDSGPEVPVVTRIPTDKKIVFITMDDGTFPNPAAPRLFAATKLPATLFLISKTAAKTPLYFKSLVADGARVEGHTVNHPYGGLKGRSEKVQHSELCNSAVQLKQIFGSTPKWFRPPYGTYDQTTLRTAKQCGYQVSVMWEASVIDGVLCIAQHQFGAGNPLQPGMILLMHFTQNFEHDYRTLLAAIQQSGYSVGRLSDYLDQTRAPKTGPHPSLVVPKPVTPISGPLCPDVAAAQASQSAAAAAAAAQAHASPTTTAKD
ncbi:polysaccharide deacetylase family protein [Fodinicola feengrottensis]